MTPFHPATRPDTLLVVAAAGLALLCLAVGPAGAQGPAGPRIEKAALDREIDALLQKHGQPLEVGVWLGGDGPAAWYERKSAEAHPTASAIKTFHLVELFAAHAGALDKPLPGADAILGDDRHPAIAHFTAAQRDEIRRELRGASVRRVGQVMIGAPNVSNAVYNAAANLATAVLGGPEALTALIRKRDPAFAAVSVRRYMLRDRKVPGDNEAPAAALAALHGRLATGRLAGVDAATLEAVRAALLQRRMGPQSARYAKDGGLTSDPLTAVRAGWWETPKGPVVYVVMLAQATPGPDGREATDQRLRTTADSLMLAISGAGVAALK